MCIADQIYRAIGIKGLEIEIISWKMRRKWAGNNDIDLVFREIV